MEEKDIKPKSIDEVVSHKRDRSESENTDASSSIASPKKKMKVGEDDQPEKENKTEEVTKEKDNTDTIDKEKLNKDLDNEKTLKEVAKDKEEIKQQPKFVFGGSTSFGAGFKVAKKNESEEIELKKNDTKSKGFSFGSGLSFGGGFNVLKQTTEVPEEENGEANKFAVSSQKTEVPVDEDKSKDNDVPKTSSPVVKLEKQEIKSGEETEKLIFQANVKLYQLNDIKEGWKERGVGVIKLNQDKETEKARLLMRSRGLLKVILNLPLLKEFSLYKGFPGSLQSEKFTRIIAVDEEKHPVQYAFKTGSEDTSLELYECIKKAML